MNKIIKKKIGILTFHYSRYNFGAVLQTYSIYKLIELLGYEPNIINYVPKINSLKGKVWNLIMSILGFRFDYFRKKFIPNILSKTQSESELVRLNNHIDGFVVGSDQVWRYIKNTETLLMYYFNFVNDEKIKISYAASFGVDYWPDNMEVVTNQVKKLLQRFDSISVREDSGVDLCNDVFGVKSVRVLDPTLLLNKEHFYKIANPKRLNKSNYLAYMMLHNYKVNEKYFRKLSEDNGLKFIRMQGKRIFPKKMMYFYNSVSDWLSYIRDAEIVITDSFHCLAFAIIFSKNFVVIANPITGVTRLRNLLSMINEESKLYDNVDQIPTDLIFKMPDYNRSEQSLTQKREKSLRFLRDSLSRV